MEDGVLWGIAGILVLLQLIACVFAKKAIVRWLPFCISAVISAFCILMYMLGGRTNWGYIILLSLADTVMIVQGAVLLANRIVRRILKR